MKGFGIYVKNNLLEAKHIEAMGEAVWLYMWCLDKMTSVNENGIGKVLGNMPVTYEQIHEELGLSDRTYRRWLDKLRDSGYIRTLRTPYGLVVTVTKAEKIFTSKRTATSGKSKGLSDRTKVANQSKRDRPYVAKRSAINAASSATSGKSNKTIQDNTIDNTSNTTNVVLANKSPDSHKEIISKLYYDAVKSLDIPITNHTTLRTKIAELARDKEPEKIINYLTFMRDQFTTTEWNYKPHVTEALHIYTKRAQIRESFKGHIQGGNNVVKIS